MKRNTMRLITLIVVIAMTISLFAAYPLMSSAKSVKLNNDGTVKTGVFEEYETEYGSVKIEAEDVVEDSSAYVAVKEKKASGGRQVLASQVNMSTPPLNTNAGIGFEVTLDRPGDYRVYVRAIVKSAGANSIWYSKNGRDYALSGLGEAYSETEYVWYKVTDYHATEEDEVLSMAFIPREPATLDCFVVTSRLAYIPSGMGDIPEGEVTFDPLKMPENLHPAPTTTPPPEHPRVLFKAEDIEQIKTNMQTSSELAPAVKKFEEYAKSEYTGLLEKISPTNFSEEGLARIEAKAFDYVINGNEENGIAAVEAMKNYLSTVEFNPSTENTRVIGQVLFTTAEVYDWCHALCTDEDKAMMYALCQTFATEMEPGVPPIQGDPFSGHAAEQQYLREWLSLAIATYDEYPDLYNHVGGKFFDEYIEPRNYWYKSGAIHVGVSYGGPTRHSSELWGQDVFSRMADYTPFSEDMGKLGYWWIYMRRPDGQTMRDGDMFNDNYNEWGAFWSLMPNTWFQLSNFYKDPIYRRMMYIERDTGISEFDLSAWSRTPVQTLIFFDPSVGTAPIDTLPLTRHFSSPSNTMIARTGWNLGMESPDVHVYMEIGGEYHSDHSHYDAGGFQIYYKGALAPDTGWYEAYGTPHDINYNKKTYAHNTLIIGTDENPGGQQIQKIYEVFPGGTQKKSEAIGAEFGPDLQYPEYSYIAGDIAAVYSSDVEEALRSMIFMPLDNEEYPAAFVVFDKITTDQDDATKKFLLHMEEKPQIEGNVTTITRKEHGYNGMLVNQTLLPSKPKIEAIGGEGKQFWIDGTNYELWSRAGSGSYDVGELSFSVPNYDPARSLELGWGRIEITPEVPAKTDYFLNVMYVGDADKEDEPVEEAVLIETNELTGAKIFDRVAMFNSEKERIGSDIKFSVEASEPELKINVAGLQAGTWAIKVNGNDIGTQVASEEGGIIYFKAPAGEYTLSRVGDEAEKTFTQSPPPEVEGLLVRLNSNYLYSDVPPTIIDGRTLIPMRALLEGLGTTVEWDETTATATAYTRTKSYEIKVTENSKTFYVNGEAREFDVPAMTINGRFMIPVRYISEAVGATVTWDEVANIVRINAELLSDKDAKVYASKWDFPCAINVEKFEYSGEDNAGNNVEKTADADFSTVWSPEGQSDDEAWAIYDLGQKYRLDAVRLAFADGDTRVHTFDISVSTDGEEYTPVLELQQTSGTTSGLEMYDLNGIEARYIRFDGRGNDVDSTNALSEIVFTKLVHDYDNLLNFSMTQSYNNDEADTRHLINDGSFTTLFGVYGDKDEEAWAIFDFGGQTRFDTMGLSYNQGTVRVYTFDLYVSDDGVNWKEIFKGQKSDGKTNSFNMFDLSGVKGRYLKYVGRGSTVNLWNSITEAIFIGERL